MFFAVVLIVSVTGGGSWVDTTFVPPSLGFENPVMIYLPEGYDPEGSVYYPVIYWLHGWGSHYNDYWVLQQTVMDSLISAGAITEMLLVKPEGWCEPYNGSMWSNSDLYGAYEDFLVTDLIEFTETAFHAIPDPACRSISGHSMGGFGCLDVGLRHTDMYAGIAAFAAGPDFQTGMDILAPIVVSESPESGPPYTYDWGNGYYTNFFFLCAGGYSPNVSAPDSVDFLLDSSGEIIDSIYARWEEHNPAHMVKLLGEQMDEVSLFFCCGIADKGYGYESNCGFADTLETLGVPYVFHVDSGGHALNKTRFTAGVLFLDSCMYETGIADAEPQLQHLMVGNAAPNPFCDSVCFTFYLQETTDVRADVYDFCGRMIDTPLNEERLAGGNSLLINSEEFPAGLYIVRFSTQSSSSSVKCILLR